MSSEEILIASLIEESWLSLEQLASACEVEPEWLLRRAEDGLIPGVESVAGTWRISTAALLRARRMRQFERDFDAVPELAALVADMLEQIDDMRLRLGSLRQG